MDGWVSGKVGHWSGGIGFYGSSVRSFVCLVYTGWPLFSFLFRFARGYLIEKSELTPSEQNRKKKIEVRGVTACKMAQYKQEAAQTCRSRPLSEKR